MNMEIHIVCLFQELVCMCSSEDFSLKLGFQVVLLGIGELGLAEVLVSGWASKCS